MNGFGGENLSKGKIRHYLRHKHGSSSDNYDCLWLSICSVVVGLWW
jgi:hypothetical protein